MTHLQPGCFGKIPLFADFVRHGPPVPEMEPLDQWLQEGIFGARQNLGAQWEAAFEATPPGRFLHYSRASGRVLGGVYAASRDKAGRRFPFLIYTVLEARSPKADAALLPILLAGFMDRATELAAAAAEPGAELKAYLARLDGLAFEPDLEGSRRCFQDFLARVPGRAFWTRVLGSPEDTPLYGLLQNLADTVGAGAVPRYALRLPGASGNLGMALWMELCRRLNAKLDLPTLAVWDLGREGGTAGVTLLFDELLAKYFLPVFWPDRSSPQLFPLKPDGAVEPARVEQARKRFGAALADPALTLAQALERFGK